MRISDWSSDVCSSDLIDTHFAELQLARMGIRPAVLEQQLHFCLPVSHRLQAPSGQFFLQAQDLRRGLSYIDIDGIELLHRCQCRRLAGGQERTLGDRRAPDAAGDWRRYGGFAQERKNVMEGKNG